MEPYLVWARKQLPHAMHIVIGFYLDRTCIAECEI
jgi:hypothetical protein